ncbi:phosphoserine phosphatase SerB [Rubrimonas cliftonensis]|uniref:Phosphoserine phosphatase n=1 Tax=Rubrimonas cliftonensis TaxID=89524 RepID=A0A1H3W4L6_9RHOB|nr:phosphoserine phosphatase SerB [Rubrimonas cliftonensis]SDZ81791.1 phosphoserine phosphatase [Rubrimonas cliftonensis]
MTAMLVITGRDPAAPAVREAARAAGARELRPLGPDAAEAALPDLDPERLARARAALGPEGDANLVPVEGREKRVLLADMDGTMIGVECIDEIAAVAGVGAKVAGITEAAMRGELDFEAALTARAALLAGFDAALLETVYETRVRLNPGAATLVRTMAKRGAATALVSGGFTFFTERVAAAAGFAEHHANVLEVAEGRLTGCVVPPILGREAKAQRLRALCAARGLATSAALAVGDGANDLAMVRAAGLGAAYRAKPALAAEADALIERSDLTALLHLQGVPREAWVVA